MFQIIKIGKWDEGRELTEEANVVLNECAGVLQYAQTVLKGLKHIGLKMDILSHFVRI